MDLAEVKSKLIREELGINDSFGKIFSFIDFANVNNWFNDDDDQTWDNKALKDTQLLEIDLKGLKDISNCFSSRSRLYYPYKRTRT